MKEMVHFIILLFVFSSSVHSTLVCNPSECWVGAEGCVTSESGVKCSACNGQGYLNDMDECILEDLSFSNINVGEIVTDCPRPDECTFVGTCLPSTFGIRCEECNGNGYTVHDFDLNNTICECYSNTFNPLLACIPLVEKTVDIVNETAFVSSYSCQAYQNRILGYFKEPGVGDVPTQCFSDVYGPPPGVLVEDTFNGNFFTCNTFCGADPETPDDTDCKTCANHGTWDVNTYSCICDEGFTASETGIDIDGNIARVCDTCWGFRGAEDNGGFCDAIVTPDPLDGQMKVCGGHGEFDRFECICTANETDGYWELATITANFKRIQGNGTEYLEQHQVQSCIACQTGFMLPTCLEIDPAHTSSPTPLPTSQSPTTSPTRSPRIRCQDGACLSRLFQDFIFLGIELYEVNYSTLAIPTDCGFSYRDLTVGSNFLNATYSNNTQENTVIASLVCQDTPQCKSWSHFRVDTNYTYFKFFESTGASEFPFPYASVGSTSGVMCS